METIKARLVGDAPLIMQADTLADPLNELTKQYKELTGKRKKTDLDHQGMADIEFRGGLYINGDGPFVPSDYIFKTLVEAARMNKEGKNVERGVFIPADSFPIQYQGPRDIKSLLADRKFHYRKTVVVGKARTIRVRPIFREWALDVEIIFDPDITNRANTLSALDRAGKYIGIGNRRPNKGGNFGRFSVEAA